MKAPDQTNYSSFSPTFILFQNPRPTFGSKINTHHCKKKRVAILYLINAKMLLQKDQFIFRCEASVYNKKKHVLFEDESRSYLIHIHTHTHTDMFASSRK